MLRVSGLVSTASLRATTRPVTGRVVARNDAVETSPETINTDPYGGGWLVEVEVGESSGVGDLLDAAAYRAHIEG